MKKIIMGVAIVWGMCSPAFAQSASNNNTPDGGLTKAAALPVLETYVPADVINKLQSKFGDKLYDITTIDESTGQPMYVVRTEDNGVYTKQIFSESQI